MMRFTVGRATNDDSSRPDVVDAASGDEGKRSMKADTVLQPVRERVLKRIRRALADGDEATALRIARELQRRWASCDLRRADCDRVTDQGSARSLRFRAR
jgi:hypothetical protein